MMGAGACNTLCLLLFATTRMGQRQNPRRRR
jgi:hypothetical protein